MNEQSFHLYPVSKVTFLSNCMVVTTNFCCNKVNQRAPITFTNYS